jgi:hypothetical protein
MILYARDAATGEITIPRGVLSDPILPKPKVGSSSLSRAILSRLLQTPLAYAAEASFSESKRTQYPRSSIRNILFSFFSSI